MGVWERFMAPPQKQDALLHFSIGSDPFQEPYDGKQDVNGRDIAAPKASARAITFNLITCGLGSAMFSFPWSMAGCSLIPAILIIAAFLFVNGWTMSIVVHAAERYEVFDLGCVVRHLPGGLGRPMQIITNACVWMAQFPVLASYIIVIHDSARKFLQNHWLGSRVVLVPLASLCVLPLCFLSQRFLEKTSSIAIGVNVYLVLLVIGFFGQAAVDGDLPQDACIFGSSVRGSFSMIAVMFQAVALQMCVLPMYEELEGRSPRKFDRIIASGFSALFVIFSGFASAGYMLFGRNVSSNILADLPHNVFSGIAQAGIIVVVACCYPIMLSPMISPLKAILVGKQGGVLVIVAKVAIVVSSMLVAMCVDSLGIVNVINGAASGVIFVALLPSFIGWLLLDADACFKICLGLLLIGGLIVSVLGLVFPDNYVEGLKCMTSS